MVHLTSSAQSKIDAYLDAYPVDGHPGTLVALCNASGETIYSRAVGGDLTGMQYDASTVFWIASCSKLITSMAAMQLVEQGKIGLDDDLGNVLPGLKSPDIILSSTATTCEIGKPRLVGAVQHL